MFYDVVIVPFMIHTVTYWVCSGLFFIADYYSLPTEQLSVYPKAVRTSLFNQCLVGLPIQYVLQQPLYNSIENAKNDSVIMQLCKSGLLFLTSNVLFYVIHRCLHIRSFYYSIHYQHHEFIEPIAAATSYAHPIEYALLNVLFFYVPCIMIGISYPLFLFLVFIGTIQSLLAHTMYHVWYGHNDHIVHHKQYTVHFGFGSFMDRLCGTTKKNK